jgi:hypothetical protein
VDLPHGRRDICRLESKIGPDSPLTFIRFSDGEMDIIRNHKAIIDRNLTHARGYQFESSFPEYDYKTFIPEHNTDVRTDILKSAMFRSKNYYIGIPTSHNKAILDRELMLRLRGGYDSCVTFSDLFVNSNFLYARHHFFPSIVSKFEKLYILCNYRSVLNGVLAHGKVIKIGDNFFSNYRSVLSEVMEKILRLESQSLLLCSASSLTNIIAYKTQFIRPDLTIIDIGTALNDYLGLGANTRTYHCQLNNSTLKDVYKNIRYRMSSSYRLKW